MKTKRKNAVKWILAVILPVTLVVLEPYGLAEGKVKTAEGKTNSKLEIVGEVNDKVKVLGACLETESISKIREDAKNSMSVLGTDNSKYTNVAKTDIIPVITDKDKIYNIKLTKSGRNELTNDHTFELMMSSKEIIGTYKVYRNDSERVNTELNITNGTNIKDVIEFTEDYMNDTYKKSPFKWVAENVEVVTAADKQDYVRVNIRPSYDGVVFKRTAMFKNGGMTDLVTCATDFRDGVVYVTEQDKIYGYQNISPNYKVERQGEAIDKILSIESVLSIVANRLDKSSVSDIRVFELAYMLNRDLSAVPIWNVVVRENGNERNFQIDAVTGYVYFDIN